MTHINRARVSEAIRRRSRHDKAMMPGKYSLFIHLNIVKLAEIIMMNNRCLGRRLRGQITRDDIKNNFAQLIYSGKISFDTGVASITDFISSSGFL